VNLREWQLQAHKAIRKGGAAEELFEAGSANFSIYSNAFRLRVRGALSDDFFLLRRLVGERIFAEKVGEFSRVALFHQQELSALAPAFFAFLQLGVLPPAALRAARLDMLELAARRAPEPTPGGKFFGLHPSAGLLEDGTRFFAVWREDGYVRRDRLRAQDYRFLSCFTARAELAEISARLEAAGLSQAFVQDSAALWTKLGLLVSFSQE